MSAASRAFMSRATGPVPERTSGHAIDSVLRIYYGFMNFRELTRDGRHGAGRPTAEADLKGKEASKAYDCKNGN